MKLFLASTYLISTALADFAAMETLYERSIQLMNVSNPNSQLRGGMVTGVLQYLQEYGCWCYFDEKHGQGHGMPQDGYDDACLALHHGTACAMLEIDNCDPKREETIAKLFIAQDGDVEYDCTSLNGGDPCKEATCYIEAWFTKLIIAQSLQHMTLPDYVGLKVVNGFDNSQCSQMPGPHVPEKFCCGTHEHNTKRMLRRGQFNPKNCCENGLTGTFKTYDPSMMVCCDDGNPRMSC